MSLEGKLQAPIEVVEQIRQKQEWRMLQQKRIVHRGHVLFQFDWTTGILEQVEYEKDPIVKENPFPILEHGQAVISPAEHSAKHRAVKYNENCFYIAALNVDNARKHLQRLFPMLKTFKKL